MLKINETDLRKLEQRFPGIIDQIMYFEEADLPICTHCQSMDTADVQIGIIGRTLHIAYATTKFKLIPNGPMPGRYFCNTCSNFFQ